jgi:hypothetical protein
MSLGSNRGAGLRVRRGGISPVWTDYRRVILALFFPRKVEPQLAKPLLAPRALLEQVEESLHLGSLLMADNDRPVRSFPAPLASAMGRSARRVL